jgi:hypothetical protein
VRDPPPGTVEVLGIDLTLRRGQVYGTVRPLRVQ